MAIEYQVVTLGIDGGRDDAFTCGVLLVAWALLRYRHAPAWRAAGALGLLAGLACLVRITALSFIVPGLVWVLISGAGAWRARLRALAPAVLVMALVIAPFLINCWRVYGDPFYAINVHADIYRQAERQVVTASETVNETTSQFLGERIRARPAEMADTILLGFTWYPFANKWTGFDPWWRGLGTLLAVASLAGLVRFAGSAEGRILLVILGSSLIPYAATWRLIGDWRFTEHVYPFLLIASFAAITSAATFPWPTLPAARRFSITRRRALGWTAVLAVVGGLTWLTTRAVPVWVAREAIASDRPINIEAGPRDGVFMGDGWSRPFSEGAVTARVATSGRADVWLPLTIARDYDLTLRLDPFPRPFDVAIERPTTISVIAGTQVISSLRLTWNPERVGAYEMRLPAALVREGWNRLTLFAPAGDRFRLWYARVRQPTTLPPAHQVQ
jgi:hypothetical protein